MTGGGRVREKRVVRKERRERERWVRSLQTIDGIRNQLNYMHTYPCRDDTDQPILLQGEIGIAVAGQNVAK